MAKGAYDVSETNVGPTKDGSFRSMLCAMLIFFSICMIILIVAWPWKNSTDKPSSLKGNKPEPSSDPNETLELKNKWKHQPNEKPKPTTTENYNEILEKNETVKIVNKSGEYFDESRETETVREGEPKSPSTNSSKLIISTTTVKPAAVIPSNDNSTQKKENPSTPQTETEETTKITETTNLSNNSQLNSNEQTEKHQDSKTTTDVSIKSGNEDNKKEQTENQEDGNTTTDVSKQSKNEDNKEEQIENQEEERTTTDTSIQSKNDGNKEETEKQDDGKTTIVVSEQSKIEDNKERQIENQEDRKTTTDASIQSKNDGKEEGQTENQEDGKTTTDPSKQSKNEDNKEEQIEHQEEGKTTTDASIQSKNDGNKEETEKLEDGKTTIVVSEQSKNEDNKEEQIENQEDRKTTTDVSIQSKNDGKEEGQTENQEDGKTTTDPSKQSKNEDNKEEQIENQEEGKTTTDASIQSKNDGNKEETEKLEDGKTKIVVSEQFKNKNNKEVQTENQEESKTTTDASIQSKNDGNKEETEKLEDGKTTIVVLKQSKNEDNKERQIENQEDGKTTTDASIQSKNYGNKEETEKLEDGKTTIVVLKQSKNEDNKEGQTENQEDDKTTTDASIQSKNDGNKEETDKQEDGKTKIVVNEDNKEGQTENQEDDKTTTDASIQSKNDGNKEETDKLEDGKTKIVVNEDNKEGQTENQEESKTTTDASIQSRIEDNKKEQTENQEDVLLQSKKLDKELLTDTTQISETELSTEPTTFSTHMEIHETDNFAHGTRFTEPPKNLNENTDDVDECKAECRKVGARILGRMNHSADPCEQFYDYACGGDNSDSASEDNWKRIAAGLDRIRAQSSDVYKTFQKFYDSCVDFHTNYDYHQRMAEAQHLLSSVGEHEQHNDDDAALTDLLTRLLQLDSSPLFDISMNVDKENKHFIFQLNIGKRFLQNDHTVISKKRKCFNTGKKHFDFSLSFFDHMNLDEMHQVYIQCMNNETFNNETLVRAIDEFGLVNFEPSIGHIEKIQEKFNKDYPSTGKIRKDIITKKIVYRKVSELEFHYPIIQWKQILTNLVGKPVHEDDLVQVYFSDFFFKIFSRKQQTLTTAELYDAIYAMYAHDLYINLVLPTPMKSPEEFCLRQSSDLMKEVASSLYLESISQNEIEGDLKRVKDLFTKMQSKLRDMIQRADWLDVPARLSLTKKINQMVLDTTWEHSQLLKNASVIQERMKSINRTYGNYSDFAAALVRRNRQMLYNMWDTMGYDESNLWWHFLTPYSTNPVSIYALNRIAIPPAMLLTSSNDIPRYMSLAKLGYSLAKAIGYHFDYTGSKYAMNLENSKEKAAYKEADGCTSASYSNKKTTTYDGKHLQFQMNEESLKLSLNERFVEAMAIHLLSEMNNEDDDYQISWIASNRDLSKLFTNEKMFFIALGQEHCRKPSLEDYFLHLFESEHLPPSLLLDTTLCHSELFSEVFDCKVGSPLNVEYKCKPFPEWPEPDPDYYEN